MTCQRCGNYNSKFPCTHCWYEQIPSYEERVKNAKIIVIGATYNQKDINKWSKIDPYYIGLGNNFQNEKQLITDHNPYLNVDWKDNIRYWGVFEKIKKELNNKKLDKIFIDGATMYHITPFYIWRKLIKQVYITRITDQICICKDESPFFATEENPNIYETLEARYINERYKEYLEYFIDRTEVEEDIRVKHEMQEISWICSKLKRESFETIEKTILDSNKKLFEEKFTKELTKHVEARGIEGYVSQKSNQIKYKFEDRLPKSEILVIGADYSKENMLKWSLVDQNYIALIPYYIKDKKESLVENSDRSECINNSMKGCIKNFLSESETKKQFDYIFVMDKDDRYKDAMSYNYNAIVNSLMNNVNYKCTLGLIESFKFPKGSKVAHVEVSNIDIYEEVDNKTKKELEKYKYYQINYHIS